VLGEIDFLLRIFADRFNCVTFLETGYLLIQEIHVIFILTSRNRRCKESIGHICSIKCSEKKDSAIHRDKKIHSNLKSIWNKASKEESKLNSFYCGRLMYCLLV